MPGLRWRARPILLSRCRRRFDARRACIAWSTRWIGCRNGSLASRSICGLRRMVRRFDASRPALEFFPAGDTLRHLVAKTSSPAARSVSEPRRPTRPRLEYGAQARRRLGVLVPARHLGDFAAMPDHVALRSANASRRQLSDAKTALRPNFEAIEAVFSNPGDQRTSRKRINAGGGWRKSTHSGPGRAMNSSKATGLWNLPGISSSARYYPDSILRPRLVYLFLRGLVQHLARSANSQQSL